jgi:Fic family protein
METTRAIKIFGVVLQNEPVSISEIKNLISEKLSIPTLNRELVKLKERGYIEPLGRGPRVRYIVNLKNIATVSINADSYFKVDTDERKIIEKFNVDVFETLKTVSIFTKEELSLIGNLNSIFQKKIKKNSAVQFKKEFERLMIELSWKSSQIEGNTYDLLDTEQLLKYNVIADAHSQQETKMLLNHKIAIDYTFKNKDLYKKMSVSKIIDIHTLLTQKMGISKNPRKRLVRITGTKYLPPDNEFVINEALENLCKLVNSKSNIFEKAFLTILLISYIQPFEDGNKRTARLSGNAILMFGNACPLSYRSVNASDYKKAILLFYELNNIVSFKDIFINQYKFAVENYF